MPPRWRKVVRDIGERPGRSLLAVMAMAAGVSALATMAFDYAILHPVLANMYGDTHPASATLLTDAADDALVDSVRRVPGVADAEGRPVIVARARIGDHEWVPAILYVVRDFDHQRMDTFRPNDGAWPPSESEMLLERSAVQVARAKRGDPITIRIPGEEDRTLRFTGTAHAPGLAPAWMEHVVYGFVPWTSRVRGRGETAQVRIVVAEHTLDEGYIHEVADRVKARIEAQGHTVTRVEVPTPGRHPHAAQMDTFMYLVGAFGLLSFVLSAVLMAGMIQGLLVEQVRQVGVMKAIGATTRQIAGLYLGQVALLAAASLGFGVPVGLLVGRGYARFSAGILNANITRSPFPWAMAAAVIVAGVLVPLLVALGPVLRASRITVHQALSDDLGPEPFGARAFERWLSRIAWLPRPLILSLRTTFLRRGRLAMTVAVLAVGGAVFISALNVAGAWNHSVVQDFAAKHFDLNVRLAEPHSVDDIQAALATVPSVAHAECWPQALPYRVGADGVAGSPVALLGLEPESRLLTPRLRDGRWLRPGDSAAVVINPGILAQDPTLRIGDSLRVRLGGRSVAYSIVGSVKELAPTPVAYTTSRAVLALTGESGDMARTFRVVTRVHSDAAQRDAARDLERMFERREIEVAGIQPLLDARKGILDHLVILMTILTLAATIVVLVGGLGLTSTLTINVVQRTREIGIMSAIGATPRAISGNIWFEGVLIGLMSWFVANALAVPISLVLETVTGRMFFKLPLDFYMSPVAAVAWLALVIVLASLSSFYPAWRATRLTVREAISHA